ncbi:hypothetical protein [Streptomyces nodosus]|uniref:hypothetical protein n=1 Tax=Streptomyces nodosus TaxID=40318 RepID=UPI00380C924F
MAARDHRARRGGHVHGEFAAEQGPAEQRGGGAAGAAGFFSLATLVCVVAMPGSDSALLETRRVGTPVCEAGGGGTVCVWPEHAHRLPEAVAAADRVARAARGVVPAPERYAEQGLERDGTGGFTLDHGRKDLLHTMLLELTGPHQTWCESEPEALAERRMYAGLRLETWLEARAMDSGKLPAYTYSGDTTWLSDVRRARKLPTAEQTTRAKEWARDMAAPC